MYKEKLDGKGYTMIVALDDVWFDCLTNDNNKIQS